MSDRPALADTNNVSTGIPTTYRLRGSNIELLPRPADAYTVTLWYVPNVAQFTTDGGNFDTIVRLDDYVIRYAGLQVAVRDSNWSLVNECRAGMAELDPELEAISRSRDKNTPSRIVDEMADRGGHRISRRRMGWRR